MQTQKFRDFITEEKKEKYRILIVSAETRNDNKLFHTAQRISDECKKLGYECYVAKINGAYISIKDGVARIHNQDDEKGFLLDVADTVAIIRGSVRFKESYLDLLTQLEKIGICVVNSRETISMCSDKYRTYLRLQDYGLTQPLTALIPNKEVLDIPLQKIGNKFPLVMKTLQGSKGVGVLFVESKRSYESLIQLLYNQDENVDLLIQEYLKTDYDVRVIVLGGVVIASMKRDVIEGDFRSNVSQGSKVSDFQLTELEIEECLLASKAVNGIWTAVDFIPSKNRETQPPYILEVNHSPGTMGVEEATEKNIVKTVIDHFTNLDTRIKVPTQCGFLEVVNIHPFGEVVAKFDTGNGTKRPTIHTDKFKINGNKITWGLFNKTITSDILKKVKVDVGGLNNYDEDRYVIKLDMEFAGTTYKDVEFMLDNREERSPILFNRKLMDKFNVMVNPQRKYVITTKYSLET